MRPGPATPHAWCSLGVPGSASRRCSLTWRPGLRGVLVLSTAGLESESPLAFARCTVSLRPVLDRIPAPGVAGATVARAAVRSAQTDGDPTDPFLVSLGDPVVVDRVAESVPVLCLVDDAAVARSVRRTRCCSPRAGCSPTRGDVFAARDEGARLLLRPTSQLLRLRLTDDAVSALSGTLRTPRLRPHSRGLASRTGGTRSR